MRKFVPHEMLEIAQFAKIVGLENLALYYGATLSWFMFTLKIEIKRALAL